MLMLAAAAAMMMSGCHLDEIIENSSSVESLAFQSGSCEVYKGGFAVCTVEASPSSAFDSCEAEFSSGNTGVCTVEKYASNSCVVYGVAEGAALIQAEMGGKKAKCAVTVKENK